MNYQTIPVQNLLLFPLKEYSVLFLHLARTAEHEQYGSHMVWIAWLQGCLLRVNSFATDGLESTHILYIFVSLKLYTLGLSKKY